jgi:hypothetical protein
MRLTRSRRLGSLMTKKQIVRDEEGMEDALKRRERKS